MRKGKVNKIITYITPLCCAVVICACGSGQSNNEIEAYAQKEHIAEREQNFTKQQTAELEKESDLFDLETVEAFMVDMNHDMQNLTDRMDRQEVVTEDEITNCIGRYYDDNLTDYVMFLYRIRPTDNGYFHDRQYGTANYMIDTDVEMTMMVRQDNFCEIGVTFGHHWERSWDKEVVPVRLEWKDNRLCITKINQWYNDFRYQYMPDELFTPKRFTEKEAQNLIKQFGTDEVGNPVTLTITADERGFILAKSNEVLLQENEIDGLSRYEIYMAAQEIYARHGKKFSDSILSQYFNRQEWYKPYEKNFLQESLSEIEEANIRILTQKGKLGELAEKDYGNLYPAKDKKDSALTEEEAILSIIHAFEMADQVICAKEENYIGTDDVFRVYSLGEYSEEASLRDYLSSWFSDKAVDYVIEIYSICKGLYRDEGNGCYQYITEGTPYGKWQEIDLLEKTEILEADDNICRVKVPFVVEDMAWWGLPDGTSSGEFLLQQKEDGWIITEITQTYYDEMVRKYEEENTGKTQIVDNPLDFVTKADAAVREFMVIEANEKPIHNREEVRRQLQKYYDDSIIDYVLYIYQIREAAGGYSYTDWYAEYAYYWADMSEKMTLLSQDEKSCEVGVVFRHGWENCWDEEVVPVKLEWQKDGWKIVDISQWYNDFRYYYMPEGTFSPEYFTRELAKDLEERFGTDEAGNRVPITAKADENGYILADSGERLLTEREIAELSEYEMYLAVQEIYARHGKKFSDPLLYWHFNNQKWYEPYHFLFYEETLSEMEVENISLLTDEGDLAEMAEAAYNSRYPVMGDGDGLTEEEAACMVFDAFEMADQVIAAKEENYLEEESDHASRVYSLGEYSEEGRLQEYLSEWFGGEVFDYLTAMYYTWDCLYQNAEGSYRIDSEISHLGVSYTPYFFEGVTITEAEENKIVVEMPFLHQTISYGEITLERRDGKWLITDISHPYYDQFYLKWQEY